jgi:hypothetical protein
LGIVAEGNGISLMGNNSFLNNNNNTNSNLSATSSSLLHSSSSAGSIPPASTSTTLLSSSTTSPSDSMLISACICLTQLALDDENAFQIRKSQGVIQLGLLFIRGAAATANNAAGTANNNNNSTPSVKDVATSDQQQPHHYSRDVQSHACRALRFLYSIERNRKIFKRFFNHIDLFSQFNDIGHYVQHIESYEALVDSLNDLPPSSRHSMLSSLDELRCAGSALVGSNGGPLVVRGYVVQEVLGKGAFGTVYMVQRENGDKQYAMKELPVKE